MAAPVTANPKAPSAKAEPVESSSPQSANPAPSGFKAWLPVIINIVMMPVLAYATVTFLVVPKLRGTAPVTVHASSGAEATPTTQEKIIVPLGGKVLVNVAGTMGTRYLLANISLVLRDPTVKSLVEKNDAELRDAAAGVLSIKTINDIEKPGARNLVRTELLSAFNTVLGAGAVTELYLTEFAIQ